MALTQNNFTGFETGGLEEATGGTTGTPDATEATVVRSGARALKCPGAATAAEYRLLIAGGGVSNAGNNQIVGVAVQFNDITPSTSIKFLVARGDGDQNIALVLEATTGDLLLMDSTDTEIGSAAAPFTVDTWHFIEIHWKEDGSTGLAEVFLDDSSVIGELTSRDFLQTAAAQDYQLSGGVTASEDTYFDDFYCMSGATAASDRLGDCEVFKYQSLKASATPDDGGDNLTTGNWGDAGETPLDNDLNAIGYTAAAAGAVDSDAANGSPEGPKNDARIDGDSNIKAIKGVWNMRRGSGPGSDHFGLLGNDVDGTTKSADFAPGTAYANKFFISVAASVVPLSTEYCRIGIETTGNQDFECGDMWAMLLHVPAGDGGTNITPPQGTLSLAGVAASLGFGFAVAAGALALTATAPAVSVGTTLTVPQATLGLTSTAPTVAIDKPIDPPQAVVTLTSVGPSLAFDMPVPQGTLVLTTAAPAVAVGTSLTVPQGTLALTSVAPSLDLGVGVPQGALLLAPVAPTIAVGLDLAIPQAVLSLTSVGPSLGLDIPVAQAALTFAAVAPAVDIDKAIEVPQATLTLTSAAPSLDLNIEVPQSTLALVAVAPSVSGTSNFIIPQASLSLASVAPALDLGIEIAQGTLSLAPVAPSLDVNITVPQAALGLVASAPTVISPVERQHYHAESTGVTENATTTPATKVSITFTPDANASYVFMWSALVSGSSESVSSIADLYDGTTVRGEAVIEPRDAQYVPIGGLERISYGASPGSQMISIRITAETTSTTARIKEARLIAIRQEAFDQWAESDGDSTENANVWTDKTTLTWTVPVADDYVIFATAECQSVTSTPRGVNCQIDIDGVEQSFSNIAAIGDDTDWNTWGAFEKAALTAASHTLKIRFRSDASSTVTIRRARLFAVPLATFNSSHFQEARTETNTTLNAYQDKVTLTATPRPAEFLAITTARRSHSGGNSHAQTRLTEAGTAIIDESSPDIVSEDITRHHTYFQIAKRHPPDVSTTWKIQFASDDVGEVDTTYVAEAAILLLELRPATVPPQGTLSLVSTAPTVDVGGDVDVTVPQGTLTLAAAAPSLDLSIAVPQGVLTLAPVAPSLDLDLPVAQAALTLTSFVPTVDVSAGVDVTIPQGTLTLAPVAPTLDLSIGVPQGALSLVGVAPAVSVGTNLAVPQGSLSIASVAPSLDLNLFVPQGILSLTSFAPIVTVPSLDTEITVPQATLGLASFAPALAVDKEIVVPQAALALTGVAPHLNLIGFDFEALMGIWFNAAVPITAAHTVPFPPEDVSAAMQIEKASKRFAAERVTEIIRHGRAALR